MWFTWCEFYFDEKSYLCIESVERRKKRDESEREREGIECARHYPLWLHLYLFINFSMLIRCCLNWWESARLQSKAIRRSITNDHFVCQLFAYVMRWSFQSSYLFMQYLPSYMRHKRHTLHISHMHLLQPHLSVETYAANAHIYIEKKRAELNASKSIFT